MRVYYDAHSSKWFWETKEGEYTFTMTYHPGWDGDLTQLSQYMSDEDKRRIGL